MGKVRLTKEVASNETIITDLLESGDIFGIISALNQGPHTETAEVIEDAEIYPISFKDLSDLIVGNPDYGFQIINDFSAQLRKFDTKIEKLTSTLNDLPVSQKLLQIGEYYYSNNKPKQALFVFKKFASLFPADTLAGEVKNKIEAIEKNGISVSPVESVKEEQVSGELLTQFTCVYQADEVMFCEHEPGEEMFILKTGRVKISKIEKTAEKTLAILSPGDIFGEMAIIEQKPRSATAETLEKTEVLVITKENFQEILKNRPEFLVKLIQIFCCRIWLTSQQLKNFTVKHPQGRLANLLALLAEAYRKKPGQIEVQLDLTVEELGQMIGLCPEESLKILNILQTEEEVKVANGKILVCNSPNMRRKADFYLKTEHFKGRLS